MLFRSTQGGWADIYLEFTFDPRDAPVATLEVWRSVYSDGREPVLVGTVPSTSMGYQDALATQVEANFIYTMRYQNGGVVGPFSNGYEMSVEVL